MNILTFILAGGKGQRLYPLTRDRAKPAVPFLGVYRIIDFVLSNAVNSGLRKIVLLTQYRSLSLDRHIRMAWDIYRSEIDGYIYTLPAQQRYGMRWYEGTADAVFQNIYTLEKEKPDYLIVLSGDHIYKMDYVDLIDQHITRDADLTLVSIPFPKKKSMQFGIIEIDKSKRVKGFEEKPGSPKSIPDKPNFSLINGGIYIFKTNLLVKILTEDMRNKYSTHDFGRDIIPKMISEKYNVLTHIFDTYWRDIGTLDSYFGSTMDFLSNSPPINLSEPESPMRTYFPPLPPAKIMKNSVIENSFIANGAEIHSAKIINSIISPSVIVKKDALVKDSIIFHRTVINPGAKVERMIVDKEVVVDKKFKREDAKKYGFEPTEKGIITIPKGWRMDA